LAVVIVIGVGTLHQASGLAGPGTLEHNRTRAD
jgi:hypothetical protein